MTGQRLTVLVVDDSAVVRQLMTTVLGHAGMEVVTASDPVIAGRKMKRQPPDVIVLDLEMPRMDGMTFLKHVMATDPVPVVVCSGHAVKGNSVALRALEEGAVDIITKPRIGVRDFLHESAVMLVDSVHAAAQARVGRRRRSVPPSPEVVAAPLPSAAPQRARRQPHVVAIGASTGGTEALRQILVALPASSPPILVVQHMPDPFTMMFARRLDGDCAVTVRQAENGDAVERGLVLIAPGSHHLQLVKTARGLAVKLDGGPLVSRHRPSVDVLFRSVAVASGAGALGILLTGMGRDGADGLLELRRSGATTVAQDEESSVVFGMPKEAIALGAAEIVAPLSQIPGIISPDRRIES